jgi:hypothetical protein
MKWFASWQRQLRLLDSTLGDLCQRNFVSILVSILGKRWNA